MTFSDVIKQYGVVSRGTLYRECIGRVLFHHEKLNTNLKPPGKGNMMRYELKRMVLRNFQSSCGRFLTTAHLTVKSNIRKTTRARANNLFSID